MDGEDSWATLKFRAANTSVDANQTTTTDSSKSNENMTIHYHHYHYNITRPSFPGYFGGHPQSVNHVQLTGPDSYRYPNYEPINYDLSYEKPANFYHHDKYNVYPGPHVNAHFSGPFSPSEYISPDLDRAYQPEYQPPYADGFKPVK
ncbi:hypothetical protein HN011_006671 [Eciton burchellii]|nr:hypothetical protein HN011_006671 [Eciton burchellii]